MLALLLAAGGARAQSHGAAPPVPSLGRSPSFGTTAEDVERIRETKPDYVLILPWNLRKEIAQQMVWIHEWGGRFVVPIPTVAVLA